MSWVVQVLDVSHEMGSITITFLNRTDWSFTKVFERCGENLHGDLNKKKSEERMGGWIIPHIFIYLDV